MNEDGIVEILKGVGNSMQIAGVLLLVLLFLFSSATTAHSDAKYKKKKRTALIKKYNPVYRLAYYLCKENKND